MTAANQKTESLTPDFVHLSGYDIVNAIAHQNSIGHAPVIKPYTIGPDGPKPDIEVRANCSILTIAFNAASEDNQKLAQAIAALLEDRNIEFDFEENEDRITSITVETDKQAELYHFLHEKLVKDNPGYDALNPEAEKIGVPYYATKMAAFAPRQ